MRTSQKSNRNRGKNNRSKSVGNITNRVFESAGPEGKVRGTPQQIIDKYEQLASDAQTSGDRVVAENFLQHAEHYARLLSAAMEEMQLRQGGDQQPDAQGGGQQRSDQRADQRPDQRAEQRHDPRNDQRGGPRHDQDRQSRRDPSELPQPDAPIGGFNGKIEEFGGADPARQDQPEIVPTPETAGEGGPRPSRRRRSPRRDGSRQPRAEGGDADAAPRAEAAPATEQPAPAPAPAPADSQGAAAPAEAPKPRRRSPRAAKPADAPNDGHDAAPNDAPKDASGSARSGDAAGETNVPPAPAPADGDG